MKRYLYLPVIVLISFQSFSQSSIQGEIDKQSASIEKKVIEWRRHIHENPELSNREFKTAEYVAKHLKDLGMKVQTGIAHTGVIGILEGGKPGPVVALRADMDGLPVVERVDIPYASKVKTKYLGEDVGVMHACGHDTHVAILMGTAEVLAGMKEEIPGTVKFIFQPAEEGAPPGEEGGADMMVKENVLKSPDVDVIFGLHIQSKIRTGVIKYRPGGTMASSDSFVIKVKGVQTHGASPWHGIDPIVISAQIIQGFQTIVSRQSNLTLSPVVISVGKIQGGVRHNIIPEEVEMIGTIRTLDTDIQDHVHERMRQVATSIAESAGATVEVQIQKNTPVTYNDPELTARMVPTLERVAGKDNVQLREAIMGAEDFAFFQKEIPGLYFFLGGRPADVSEADAAPHHTPDFFIDDSNLTLGVRAFCNLVFDYAENTAK